jgi:REP element-mobilizing transposase RayT
MSGIVSNLGHKPIIINGMSDHVHILVGLRPDKCISDLVKEVKRSSTNYINDRNLMRGKFAWQEGYGAFAHSNSNLPRVINYIQNQEIHHKKMTYRKEYLKLLQKYNVDYNPKWIK